MSVIACWTSHALLGACRATIAPFLANITAGIDSYKWILFGDDDTAFYIDNALRMLSTLDHNMPYVLSDHIWFPTDIVSKSCPALLLRILSPGGMHAMCLPGISVVSMFGVMHRLCMII